MSVSTATVTRLVRAQRAVEGDGFVVRRPFPTASLSYLDPFLLFDHLGPVEFGPGEGTGTPWHPHRGFETVTYLLEGDAEHRDSMGNHGFLRAGDTQWMTAGSGVLHKEGPSAAAQASGGRSHGLQLWVNLPASLKMTAPAYQDLRAEENAIERTRWCDGTGDRRRAVRTDRSRQHAHPDLLRARHARRGRHRVDSAARWACRAGLSADRRIPSRRHCGRRRRARSDRR